MLTGILDVMIISLGPALLLVLFVVGMVTTFAALARSQRQAREIERQNVRQRELQIGRIRRATVTASMPYRHRRAPGFQGTSAPRPCPWAECHGRRIVGRPAAALSGLPDRSAHGRPHRPANA